MFDNIVNIYTDTHCYYFYTIVLLLNIDTYIIENTVNYMCVYMQSILYHFVVIIIFCVRIFFTKFFLIMCPVYKIHACTYIMDIRNII